MLLHVVEPGVLISDKDRLLRSSGHQQAAQRRHAHAFFIPAVEANAPGML
jgi:hypothetical protein